MALSYPTDSSEKSLRELLAGIVALLNQADDRSVDVRAIVNAIFYIVVAGVRGACCRRTLPKWKRSTTTFERGDWMGHVVYAQLVQERGAPRT